jgi:hypothetical protein
MSGNGTVLDARRWSNPPQHRLFDVEARRASADAGAVPRDKRFEVETPDGRKVRHRHHSLEALRKALQPGYRVVAEVFAADSDDKGGLVEPIGQSTMKTLLAAHGDELLAFLAERGIIGSAGNRELGQ